MCFFFHNNNWANAIPVHRAHIFHIYARIEQFIYMRVHVTRYKSIFRYSACMQVHRKLQIKINYINKGLLILSTLAPVCMYMHFAGYNMFLVFFFFLFFIVRDVIHIHIHCDGNLYMAKICINMRVCLT